MKRTKFEMEFIFRASPTIIYSFLTENSNLVRWFCDEVDIEGDEYTFYWQGSAEHATLIDDIEEERVRFHWEDYEDEEYSEFRIYKSDVTNETILEITDFCDDDEVDEQKDLWSTQMEALKIATGGG